MKARLLDSRVVATDNPPLPAVGFWTGERLTEDDIVIRIRVPDNISETDIYIRLTVVDAVTAALSEAAAAYEPSKLGDAAWKRDAPVLYSAIWYKQFDSVPCLICQETDAGAGLWFENPVDINEIASCYVHIDCVNELREALASVYDHSGAFLSTSL